MKRNRNKKIKSAYRPGEKVIMVLKAGIIFISSVVLLLTVALGIKRLGRALYVRNIVVHGNYHLEEEDVAEMLDAVRGASLLGLSFEEVDSELKRNPWIKGGAVRKQFPHTLHLRITEAVPKALLDYKGHTYLVEQGGGVLEEIRGEVTSFLPVISGVDPVGEKQGFLESLKLVEALSEGNVLSNGEPVEITLESSGPEMLIDGETIKVGYGEYIEKLRRWKELRPQMTKIGPASYIDLRFQDKVIVKPFRIVGKKDGGKGQEAVP